MRQRHRSSALGRNYGREQKRDEAVTAAVTAADVTGTNPSDTADGAEQQQQQHRAQRQVIVNRDERGYGFSVTGDNPVYVKTVKENGAAARAGVQCGDIIVKVNGTLVTGSNHDNVVNMIKSGRHVALTLLGQAPAGGGPPSATPRHLAESTVALSTPAGPLTGNPVLDREKISAPQAVDKVKGQEVKAQTLSTVRLMYEQVLEDFNKIKSEYRRNPTEHIHKQLEAKQQMLRRMKNQLGSMTQVDSQKLVHSDSESTDSRDTPAAFPPASLPPSGAKHRRTESMPDALFKVGRRIRDRMSLTLVDDVKDDVSNESERTKTSASFDDSGIDRKSSISSTTSKTAWSDSMSEASLPRGEGETGLKTSAVVTGSDAGTSDGATAAGLPELSVVSQSVAVIAEKAEDVVNIGTGSQQQVNVMSMDDDDFSTDEEHVDEPGIFSDISQLMNRPAHIAVFLHYLLSNCDPSPLLFYLVTETYPVGSVKEMRKWAYEIYSTFLCDKSPLLVLVDSSVVSAIDSTLQHYHDKDDAMKVLFTGARNVAQSQIADLLSDFRQKRQLGLGCFYGDHELRDNMDRHSELKAVDSALWKHFEQLVQDEDSDRSQAMASALATFFRHISYTGFKNNSVLERCPYFNAKDRKFFKFPKATKKSHVMGHHFIAQQYFSTTLCHCCQTIIWGIGNQGYQCSNCEINVHKNCMDRIHDACLTSGSTPSSGGTLRKKRDKARQPSVFDKIISRKPSTNSAAAIKEAQVLQEGMHSPSTTSVVSMPPDAQGEEEPERKRRNTRDKRVGFGISRAFSMPSVCDVTQLPKNSSAYVLAKAKVGKREEEIPEQSTPNRVHKLVARYSELGKSLASPLDDVTSSARSQSPVQEVIGESEENEHENRLVVTVGRSESLNQKGEARTSVRRAHSDVQADETARKAVVSSGSSSSSSLSVSGESAASNSNEGFSDPGLLHRPSFTQPTPSSTASIPNKSVQHRVLDDPDLDTEVELPPLEAVIPKELLRKLKPKEKKRQEVINELFYTEKAHVRVVKVLQHIFYQPMHDETWISDDFVNLLFPNIDDLVELHSSLNSEFVKKREDAPIVENFAEILVNQFSSSNGERFAEALCKFCRNQSHALEMLRVRQRKDQKFANFIQDAANNPHCRRLELKDFIPMTMQRLTKYPLLIESLMKYTQSNTTEYELLTRAHECSKNILNEVNRAVQECENHQRLVEIQRRLDRRPIENSSNPAVAEFKRLDVTKHRMLYEGPLTWRIGRTKHVDLHVLLLEDILVLLQQQDERFVLRCQSMTVVAGKEDTKFSHSPIIKLHKLLTRNVATDKRAFFLVSTSDVKAQIYELVANSRDEKNKWFKHITDAAEAYKVKDGGRSPKQSGLSQPSDGHVDAGGPALDTSTSSADVTSPVTPTSFIHDDVELNKTRGSVESLDAVSQGIDVVHVEPSRLVQPNEVVISSTVCMEKPSPVMSPHELLSQKTEEIERMMNEKKALIADILQIPLHDYDTITEMVNEERDSNDARELLLSSVLQADTLTHIINKRITAEHVQQQPPEDTAPSQCNVGGFPVVVSGVQLLSISTRLHHSLSRLAEVLIQKLQENERLKSELSELQSRLDTVNASVTPVTEELRPQPLMHSETPHYAINGRPDSFVSLTSTASESIEEAELATAAVTTEPVVLEQLEMVETMPEPTVIDAAEVVVVTNELLTSDEAFES